MATLRAQPGATVQVLGWDEAFIGVETDDPERYAREVQAAVLDRTALHCSVGIGDTLVRAKVATGFGKPRGVFRLTADNWLEVMGAPTDHRPVGRRHQDLPAPRGPRHPHRRRPRGGRRGAAGRRVRPEDGSWYRAARARRRVLGRRRHPVGGARPQPRDDVPAGPHRAARRSRTRSASCSRQVLARRRGRRPAGDRAHAQGALRAVLHEDLHQEDPATFDRDVVLAKTHGARRRRSNPTARSGCSESGPRCPCPTTPGRVTPLRAAAGSPIHSSE